MEITLDNEKKDNTVYTIKLGILTILNGKVYKNETLPYLGIENMTIKKGNTKDTTFTPIYPDVKVVRMGKNEWTTGLRMEGLSQLQENLDFIYEAIHTGVLNVASIIIEADNPEWK